MKFNDSRTYFRDLKRTICLTVGINSLKGKNILITGASGLIGSFIVDVLTEYNNEFSAGIKIFALSRNNKVETLGADNPDVIYFAKDVTGDIEYDFHVDYIIHAAGNAHPYAFTNDPVGTMMSNVVGTYKLLEYGRKHGMKRFVFISSGEIYGFENTETDSFSEDFYNNVKIDISNPRSCYPEGKRAGETLCAAYTEQYNVETVSLRLCHTYGPGFTQCDNRAGSDFFCKGMRGEEIRILNAEDRLRSYCYVADSVSAILTAMLSGKAGQPYNVADSQSQATVAAFAQIVGEKCGVNVDLQLRKENQDESTIIRQVLDAKRLEGLGWHCGYDLRTGIEHTIQILKEESKSKNYQ